MDLAGSLSTLPSIDSMISLLAESHADIDLARLSAPDGQPLEQPDMLSVPTFTPTEMLISTVDRDTRSNSDPVPPPPKTHCTASANSKTILGSIPTVFSFTPSLESQQETPKNEADAENPFVVVRRSSKRKVNALIKVYRRVMKPYHVRKAKRMAWKIVEAAEKAAVCDIDGAGKDAAYAKAKRPTKLGLGLAL
ncbi:hypothetical protein DL93DRAFT_771193 [Clavulina sp. PMI_390]|nr:hypothetical protein DL93DRAFT_771193 [Clavulina sp. PMI_390]